MGGSELDLSQIPLMTPAQEQALAQLLPAVMGMMSGFPLGGAYGGPSESSYGVTSFPAFDLGGIENAQENVDKEKTITKDQLTDPNKKKTITKDQLIDPSDSVLDLILNPAGQRTPTGQPSISIPSMGGGMPMLSPVAKPPSMGGGKGGASGTQPISPTQTALTQPIISPFTQGMTGNFPKRRPRRGGE